MALREYYDTGADGVFIIFASTHRVAQTFTAAAYYDISSVALFLSRIGLPGTVTVEIQGVTTGKPNGTVYATGTTNGDTLVVNNSGLPSVGDWREITFSFSYSLTSGIVYAIVVSVAGASTSKKILWPEDDSSPTYTDGTTVSSTDSGSTWTIASGSDMMFRNYGDLTIQHYDEGILIILGVGSVALPTEDAVIAAQYDEGVLVASGIGTISLFEESFSPAVILTDTVTVKRLVAVGNSKVYYEVI
jgi:hypothetical protein